MHSFPPNFSISIAVLARILKATRNRRDRKGSPSRRFSNKVPLGKLKRGGFHESLASILAHILPDFIRQTSALVLGATGAEMSDPITRASGHGTFRFGVSARTRAHNTPIRYGHVFFLLYVSQAVALHEVHFDVSPPKHHLRHLLGIGLC